MKFPFSKFFGRIKVPLDKIIERTVALGVPGLVLVVAIAFTGLAGGAAIVAALAALGGPAGMIGGIFVLGLLLLISQAVAEYGFETIFLRVLRGLKAKGLSKAEILKKIDSYPISLDLKLKLRLYVDKFWDDDGPDTDGQGAKVRPPKIPGEGSSTKDIPS